MGLFGKRQPQWHGNSGHPIVNTYRLGNEQIGQIIIGETYITTLYRGTVIGPYTGWGDAQAEVERRYQREKGR